MRPRGALLLLESLGGVAFGVLAWWGTGTVTLYLVNNLNWFLPGGWRGPGLFAYLLGVPAGSVIGVGLTRWLLGGDITLRGVVTGCAAAATCAAAGFLIMDALQGPPGYYRLCLAVLFAVVSIGTAVASRR